MFLFCQTMEWRLSFYFCVVENGNKIIKKSRRESLSTKNRKSATGRGSNRLIILKLSEYLNN